MNDKGEVLWYNKDESNIEYKACVKLDDTHKLSEYDLCNKKMKYNNFMGYVVTKNGIAFNTRILEAKFPTNSNRYSNETVTVYNFFIDEKQFRKIV